MPRRLTSGSSSASFMVRIGPAGRWRNFCAQFSLVSVFSTSSIILVSNGLLATRSAMVAKRGSVAHSGWPIAFGLAVTAHHPRRGLQDGIVARPVRQGPGLAVGRDRKIDQARVLLLQAGVVKAVAVQDARPEVLDHHVGFLEQLQDDLLSF